MREVDLQSQMVKAIVTHGGFAFKLSNRFLVGVADLFVKLPAHNAAFIEVKYDEAPKQKTIVIVEPTPLQTHFLEATRKSGCITGVASFLKRGFEVGLHLSAVPGKQILPIDVYSWAKPRDRDRMIWQQVEEFIAREDYNG